MSDPKVLDRIDEPSDLKQLDPDELVRLAQEIRQLMVKTVARNGGHLAPNLGVVELTLALHLALDSPRDKIVWDVGHQAYVHKILTGRRGEFATIRQRGGLSGFPRRSESPHDSFDTGHASTSISVALGLAAGRDKNGTDEVVVAVIGDGALTGGVAFEALNQAGHLKTPLIVVLNDNNMSIGKNVGAMASYLARIRFDPAYNRLKQEIEERVKRIPGIGEKVAMVGHHLKEGIKHFLVPGGLFEELGFTYIGPIDGHDVGEVRRTIEWAKQYERPVLIHAVTEKGRGYGPAERKPEDFHGAAPFVVRTGSFKSAGRPPTYTNVFGDCLCRLAKADERLIGITAAMPQGTGLEKFARDFPDRFYDVGIAEQHAVTFAAGLALQGFVPVAAVYSTFLSRAYDQIVQDVALQKLPVVFAVDRAGVVGEDGPTHQGAFDISYLRHIPGMTIMAPSDENELCQMLYTATRLGGPVAIRYPRSPGTGASISEDLVDVPVGKVDVVCQYGLDVAIIALGRMVAVATEAASELKSQGVEATVVNARFAKPLDTELIASLARRSDLLVTVEDGALLGGFGSAVLESLQDTGVGAEIERLGLPDSFVTHGEPLGLLAELGLDAAGICARIMKRLKAAERARATLGEGEVLKDILP